MLGRLLKYDFRSMWKQFAMIWPAALILAVVNRFTLSGLDSTSAVGETTAGVAMLMYVAILIAMFIIAVIFVIQRFFTGLLGDEGYLMHTLPVKPWELIAAKLVCAVVTTMVNILVAILSILLLIPVDLHDVLDLFRFFLRMDLWDLFRVQTAHVVLGAVEMILMIGVLFAVGYLQLYLSMAVGHLFNKNRVAMSVVAFLAINVVQNAVLVNLARPLAHPISSFINAMNMPGALHASLWITIIGEAVVAAIYFFGTEYILRNKLNLE